ncbi:MAG: hypothetical protein JSS36_06065 [Proteobacteria bacterium]|nr:hypothetical protein [Pseudomonadota bacterium]
MWGETVVNETVRTPRGQRIAFDVAVRYRQGSSRATVLLRNLTREGARIEGVGHLRVGDVAMIQLPGLAPKAAKVAWRREHAAGFEFERPLHPDIFDKLVEKHAIPRARLISDLEPEVEAARLVQLKRALRVA